MKEQCSPYLGFPLIRKLDPLSFLYQFPSIDDKIISNGVGVSLFGYTESYSDS